LIENPFPNRKQTWVNGTPAWINRVGPRVDNIREAVCLLKPKRTENLWYTMVKRHAYQREQIGTKAISWVNYEKTAMTKTNQWLHQALSWPQLTGGCINLLRCRIGAFWTAEKLVRIGKLSDYYSHICPFCLERQPETIPHMIVTCLAWSVERQRYLGALLEGIKGLLEVQGGESIDSIGVSTLLLGGQFGSLSLPGWCHHSEKEDINDLDTSLMALSNEDRSSLGFLRVAAFLQVVQARRMACLGRIGMNPSRADAPIGVGQDLNGSTDRTHH